MLVYQMVIFRDVKSIAHEIADTQTLLFLVFRNHLAADTGPGAVFTPSPPPQKNPQPEMVDLPSMKLTQPMKILIFPGKYHQNGGFSMAMLVTGV